MTTPGPSPIALVLSVPSFPAPRSSTTAIVLSVSSIPASRSSAIVTRLPACGDLNFFAPNAQCRIIYPMSMPPSPPLIFFLRTAASDVGQGLQMLSGTLCQVLNHSRTISSTRLPSSPADIFFQHHEDHGLYGRVESISCSAIDLESVDESIDPLASVHPVCSGDEAVRHGIVGNLVGFAIASFIVGDVPDGSLTVEISLLQARRGRSVTWHLEVPVCALKSYEMNGGWQKELSSEADGDGAYSSVSKRSLHH